MWDFNYYIHILWCISGDKAECIWEKIYYITGNLIFSLIQDNLITLNLNICGDFYVPNFVVEKWSLFKLDRGKPKASALNFLSFWSIASTRKEQTVLKLWGTLKIYFGLESCRLAILTFFFTGLILFPHLSGSCFEVSGSWKHCNTIFFPLWFWFCLNVD